VQDLGVAGFLRECLSIEGLGLVEASGPVVGGGKGENLSGHPEDRQ
jgi:hypothetical protein